MSEQCPFDHSRSGTHGGKVATRHLNTRYVHEENNWMTSCYECYKETWELYDGMWSDSGQGSPYSPTPPPEPPQNG